MMVVLSLCSTFQNQIVVLSSHGIEGVLRQADVNGDADNVLFCVFREAE